MGLRPHLFICFFPCQRRLAGAKTGGMSLLSFLSPIGTTKARCPNPTQDLWPLSPSVAARGAVVP